MSERKVLNKYYPPDFDPSKIPKLKGAKVNKQWSIRIMAPFNMRCNTCGEYIYKGKKFNSKKETVEDEDYLGLHIFRFYIKCPRCVAEIAFKTDPQSTDYSLEAGATRNFEASKTAEEMAKKEQAAIEEEEANNPMKVLENRTKQSMQEMEMIETLEELKEMNTRHARVDFNTMLLKHQIYEEQLARLQDDEDDKLISSVFGKDSDKVVKRLNEDDEGEARPAKRLAKGTKPTDILTGNVKAAGSKSSLSGLVKPKSSVKAKSSLAGLIKPKTDSKPKAESAAATRDAEGFIRPANPPSAIVKPSQDTTSGETQVKVKPVNNEEKDSKDTTSKDRNGGDESKTKEASQDHNTQSTSTATKALPGALGLLGGAYSDSEEDSE